MDLYRIIWRRNNGATYPATFHVIDSVHAADLHSANQLAQQAHPECEATDLACVPDAELNAALTDATAQAEARATQEGWDGLARMTAEREAHERDKAEIAARALAAEKAMVDRRAAALADAMQRVAPAGVSTVDVVAGGAVDVVAGVTVDTGGSGAPVNA